MKIETVGEIASRAIGANLIILGSAWLLALLPDFLLLGASVPGPTISSGDGSLEKLYQFFTTRNVSASACIGPGTEIISGVILIVLSRRIGTLLVRGLGIEGGAPRT